jgi:hypothetical protein
MVEPWQWVRLTVIVREIELGPVEGVAEVIAVVARRVRVVGLTFSAPDSPTGA